MDENHAKVVSKAIRNLSMLHGKPVLVVIDTLARNFGSGDESKTQDMNQFIYSIDMYIRLPFSCCVLIVHHTGHNEKERARGAPDKGINQGDLIEKIKTNLVNMSNAKAQVLLHAGVTAACWRTEKGKNNATIYKLFSGFPSYKDQETEKPME